eukprot:6406274-Prymnesium_polylepis.1
MPADIMSPPGRVPQLADSAPPPDKGRSRLDSAVYPLPGSDLRRRRAGPGGTAQKLDMRGGARCTSMVCVR